LTEENLKNPLKPTTTKPKFEPNTFLLQAWRLAASLVYSGTLFMLL